MMRLNIDQKTASVEAARMRVPEWHGKAAEMLPASAGTLLDGASKLSEDKLRVRGVSTSQDSSTYSHSGLMASGVHDDPITLDPQELNDWARRDVPVEEEPDCADWMVPAYEQFAHAEARANEYSRAGGSLLTSGGGAYMPSINNGKLAFKSEDADTVSDDGATIVTTDGSKTMSLDAPGASTFVTSEGLHWAVANNLQDQQWVGTLFSVQELVNNPSDPIGFPRVDGHSGPLFVGHEPSRPSILNRVSVTSRSDTAQTLQFKLRSSLDYNRVIRSFSQDIPKGKSTTDFRLLSIGISPMVMEIQPEDGTSVILDDYSVFP